MRSPRPCIPGAGLALLDAQEALSANHPPEQMRHQPPPLPLFCLLSQSGQYLWQAAEGSMWRKRGSFPIPFIPINLGQDPCVTNLQSVKAAHRSQRRSSTREAILEDHHHVDQKPKASTRGKPLTSRSGSDSAPAAPAPPTQAPPATLQRCGGSRLPDHPHC